MYIPLSSVFLSSAWTSSCLSHKATKLHVSVIDLSLANYQLFLHDLALILFWESSSFLVVEVNEDILWSAVVDPVGVEGFRCADCQVYNLLRFCNPHRITAYTSDHNSMTSPLGLKDNSTRGLSSLSSCSTTSFHKRSIHLLNEPFGTLYS